MKCEANHICENWVIGKHVILSYYENDEIGKHVLISSEITATSLGITGNIHPNPNHLPECLHVMAHENRRAIVTK